MEPVFTSDRSWRFGVTADELWSTIADVHEFPTWWPWLRRFEAEALREGDRWRCVVQPPLPYVVRFVVALDRVVEGELAEASVSGDIGGRARLEVVPDGDGCRARLVSTLAPSSPLLRGVGRVAGPLIKWGHDWVLDQGARQFVRRVGAPIVAD